MSAGPLRTLLAGFGLVALVPIAWLAYSGDIDLAVAGTRAGIVLAAVLVVGRIAELALSVTASSLERRAMRRLLAPDSGSDRGGT